jgi:serine/threonine-protein kinase RsbW
MGAERMSWVIPANLDEVNQICSDLTVKLALRLHADDLFALHMLARESLNNAVIHGCSSQPAKRITCEVWLENEELSIRICDEGPGFNWRSQLTEEIARADRTDGRGLFVYQIYANRIEFNSSGNCVTLVRKIVADKTRQSGFSERQDP